jgi:hypothetical protein
LKGELEDIKRWLEYLRVQPVEQAVRFAREEELFDYFCKTLERVYLELASVPGIDLSDDSCFEVESVAPDPSVAKQCYCYRAGQGRQDAITGDFLAHFIRMLPLQPGYVVKKRPAEPTESHAYEVFVHHLGYDGDLHGEIVRKGH